jgi:hypothetical protein
MPPCPTLSEQRILKSCGCSVDASMEAVKSTGKELCSVENILSFTLLYSSY